MVRAERSRLFQQFSNVNGQAWKDPHRHRLGKGVNGGRIIGLIVIDGCAFYFRIYDPVFPDAGGNVQAIFYVIIHPAAGGRRHFDNEIQSPRAVALSQFISITDHGNIRLYPVAVVCILVLGQVGELDDGAWAEDFSSSAMRAA